jgi:hypothetical protein
MMPDQSLFIYSHLSKLFSKIWRQGGLTVSDRQGLMLTLLKSSLCEEELSIIDRILHAVRRGWLQIID